MKFISAEIFETKLPFRLGFKHALAERKFGHTIFIRLRAESGACGWGEVVPRDYLTGESIQSCWDDIINLWWPAVRELEFSLDAASVCNTLNPLYLQADQMRRTAAFAGIDLAVYDGVSTVVGKSLHEFLGLGATDRSFNLSAPLGGSSSSGVRRKALLFKLLGFNDYKIKLGMGIDREVTAAARKVIGSGRDLRADANAGWSVDKAISALADISEYGISSIEQPVADIAGLAKVRAESGVRVMADESLCTLSDARELIEAKAADIWNIRLAKIGGFSGLFSMLELAGENNIALHLGSLVGETSLLQAAGRIAAATADFAHVEYSFPRIFLKPDPFRGGPAGYFGKGSMQTSGTGLGVCVHPKSLGKVCLRKLTLD